MRSEPNCRHLNFTADLHYCNNPIPAPLHTLCGYPSRTPHDSPNMCFPTRWSSPDTTTIKNHGRGLLYGIRHNSKSMSSLLSFAHKIWPRNTDKFGTCQRMLFVIHSASEWWPLCIATCRHRAASQGQPFSLAHFNISLAHFNTSRCPAEAAL